VAEALTWLADAAWVRRDDKMGQYLGQVTEAGNRRLKSRDRVTLASKAGNLKRGSPCLHIERIKMAPLSLAGEDLFALILMGWPSSSCPKLEPPAARASQLSRSTF